MYKTGVLVTSSHLTISYFPLLSLIKLSNLIADITINVNIELNNHKPKVEFLTINLTEDYYNQQIISWSAHKPNPTTLYYKHSLNIQVVEKEKNQNPNPNPKMLACWLMDRQHTRGA